MAVAENAEAGPSKPRGSSPLPSTPPPAATRHVKRRSWFGLGSPMATATAAKEEKKKEGQQRGSDVTSTPTEDVELQHVSAGAIASQPPPSAHENEEARTGGSTAYAEELLTIDGDVEKTVKKKKKRRSKGNEEEFEVMRMSDLGGREKVVSSSRAISDEAVDLAEGEKTPSTPFTRRTFSRIASDRDPFPLPSYTPVDPDTTPRSSIFPSRQPDNPRPPISPRTSSITSTPSPSIPFHTDKSLPPIVYEYDRPLPPLPPSPENQTADSQIPQLPHGIVVTPSSPHQATHPASQASMIRMDKRSRSAEGRSENSYNHRPLRNRNSNGDIGLGLPTTLNSSSTADEPPPVPSKSASKPQSVSSPLPSRSASPIPKIAFVEPDEPPPERDRDRGRQPNEPRKLVKRARSLSGLWSKSPSIPQNTHADSRPSPDANDSAAIESNEGGTTRTQGVLEWLGVRKTVKRRHSEAKFRGTTDASVDHVDRPSSREELLDDAADKNESRESLAGSETIDGHTQQTPRRPQVRHASSSSTPQGTPGKIASLFSRRASARSTADDDEINLAPPLPAPIPIGVYARIRHDQQDDIADAVPASASSSFGLPAVDPISPLGQENAPWVSSPGTEGDEEVLYNSHGLSHWGPGVRPWMDGTEIRSSSRSSISSSHLKSLPEQLAAPAQALRPPLSAREGRVRSWSDAPRPPPSILANSSQSHLPPSTPTSPGGQLSRSLQPSSQASVRPSLGSRSNSGNSAIIGRMKSVFSKSTGRNRSNSLLRRPSSDIDEFGGLQGSQRMRPSTSSSSVSSSFVGRRMSPVGGMPMGNQLNLSDSPRTSLERSPRTSLAPSISSVTSGSTRPSVGFESPHKVSGETATTARKNRARASTIALGPSSYHFAPPSPSIFPAAATPPRRRPGTMHRLSTGLFGSGPSSPRATGSLFPLPPRSSGSISSVTTAGAPPWDELSTGTGLLSPGTSPRPSTGSIPPMTSAAIKQISAREGDETPKQWLERVVTGIGRHDIAGVLAASSEDFHSEALQLYMGTFDFTHNALDVALRRLLMHMSLPKETQQIDRVIEGFARRYEQCEPGLFGAKDNTYVLAFSMMMLHTDAFNKHNKNKMTKADYVRNTRMEGVPPLVLEAFFDNITFTPFVFIEDDLDLRRSSGYESSSSVFGPSTPAFSGVGFANGPLPPPKTSKIDVYHMIVRGLLGSLRVEVEHQIPAENPYSALGTRPFLDMSGLHRAFADAHGLLIPAPGKKMHGKFTTPARRGTISDRDQGEGEMMLRVTKVGLLSRKDDGSESKKASRKWKSWSVILTGSQILFFKDPVWALTLIEQAQNANASGKSGQQLLLPRMTTFKPDEVFPVKDCITLWDRTFTAYANTFRFVMPGGQQYLLQAPDEYEMNEWITLINYASAFKSAGIKMRGSTMRKDQAALAGAAAAASHRRLLQGGDGQTSLVNGGRKAVFGEPAAQSSQERCEPSARATADLGTSGSSMTNGDLQQHHMPAKNGQVVEVDPANEVVHEGDQLEEVFGAVKAELAAGRGGASAISTATQRSPSKAGFSSMERTNTKAHARSTSRVEAIQIPISTFRNRLDNLESSLVSSLLLARNLALLTAFQKTTRDRIASSIPAIAQKVRLDRIQLTKLRLYLQVLEHEKGVEEREFARVRHVALQAAAKSLKGGVGEVVKDLDGDNGVPVLALPAQDGIGNENEKDNEEEAGERGRGEETERSDAGDGEEEAEGQEDEEEENSSRRSNDRTGTSPGELPLIFRRTSDDLPARTSSRQSTRSTLDPTSGSRPRTPTAMFLSPEIHHDHQVERLPIPVPVPSSPSLGAPASHDSNDGAAASSGAVEQPDDGCEKQETEKETSGRSTPMMIFAMESPIDLALVQQERDDPIASSSASAIRSSDDKAKGASEAQPTGTGKETERMEETEQEQEQAEEWHSTRAARRVSLVRAGEKGEWEKIKMTMKELEKSR